MSVEQKQVSFTFLEKSEDRQEAIRIYNQIERIEKDTCENKIELIKALGDVFVVAKIPAREISTRLASTIGGAGAGIVADSWIRKVCAKVGWTREYDNSLHRSDSGSSDSLYTIPKKNPDDINSWDGKLDAAKQIAREQGRDENEVTLEKIVPYYVYRYPYYKFFHDTIELFRKFLEEIQKDFDEEVDDSGKKIRRPRNWQELYESIGDMHEYHKALGMLYDRAADAYRHREELLNVNYNAYPSGAKAVDNRQSILPYMYLPILAKLSITTIKHFSSKHFSHVKAAFDTITTKKTTQFTKSPDSVSDLLESTMDDAWKWHYIDIKCPQCKSQSLKPKMLLDGTWNFVCKNWQFHGKAHGKEEVSFAPTLLAHRINALTLNIGRASQKYLKDRGMAAPEDLQ